MKNYKVVWRQPGKPSFADVSFQARSDYEARRKADRIGRELGLTDTWRALWRVS